MDGQFNRSAQGRDQIGRCLRCQQASHVLDGDSIAKKFSDEAMFAEAVKAAEFRPVSEFMSADFNSVELTDNLMSVATTAIANKRARIPVVDQDNHPIGIISRQGLKHIIAKFLGLPDIR